jgi:hypothetical protein
MAIAHEEPPERVAINEGTAAPSLDRDGDDATALPVASPVSPPPELLERVNELENKRRVDGEAIPIDIGERHRLEAVNRRKQRWIVGGCVILALAILGIALGVTFGRKSTPSPTSETAAPTPTPTSERFASLKELIKSVSFDGGAALSDPLSPQYKALKWLDGNEELEESSIQKTIQRYALAVFYYSTSGETWTKSYGWLTGQDECTWFSSAANPVCDESGVFLRLQLTDNNLAGSVPSELALLSDSLLALGFMNDEKVTGTLGLLKNVESFIFQSTALSGTIPTELGRLKMKSDKLALPFLLWGISCLAQSLLRLSRFQVFNSSSSAKIA